MSRSLTPTHVVIDKTVVKELVQTARNEEARASGRKRAKKRKRRQDGDATDPDALDDVFGDALMSLDKLWES